MIINKMIDETKPEQVSRIKLSGGLWIFYSPAPQEIGIHTLDIGRVGCRPGQSEIQTVQGILEDLGCSPISVNDNIIGLGIQKIEFSWLKREMVKVYG